jgi:CRP/FNR family transcriptional regulator
MQRLKACDLAHCFLCQSCIPEWHQVIALNKQTLRFKKGEVIFAEGDPVNGIHFVYKGLVKVHKHWDKQKELILRFVKEGEILGARGLGKRDRYPVTATALEPVELCFVDTDFFLSSLKTNPELSLRLSLFYANELHEAEERMRNLAHMDSKGRIADLLLKLQEQFGNNESGYLQIILSRQDMAAYAGTTYETVFRALQEMQEAGWIKTNGKQVGILQVPALQKLAKVQL